MGIAKGAQPLPFGHSAEAAVDIEGLVVRLPCEGICSISLIPLHSSLRII